MDPKDTHLEPVIKPSIADHLRAAGITREFIRRMTEPGDDLRNPLTPTREAQYTDDPAALLLRLFFCHESVDPAELPPEIRDCGLLVKDEAGSVSSPLHLRLVRDLFLFSDYLDSVNPDAVMGAGETTAILYRAGRPRTRVGSALDLGCGAGTLALLLAADADRVIGTDINPRAVEIGRLNATVNHIANCEFRAGDMYAPVDGERFDLILSQPPYYPLGTGGSDLTFLHGGVRGDELPTRAMRGIPDHLASGGRALVFTSWPLDAAPMQLPGHDVLELFTNRRELHGTRQSLDVVRGGAGWSERFEVPADCWGFIDPSRIDELFAAEDLLRQPERWKIARLKATGGMRAFREGDQLVLNCTPESLIGCTAVDDRTWRAVQAIERGATVEEAGVVEVQQALKRGLLAAC